METAPTDKSRQTANAAQTAQTIPTPDTSTRPTHMRLAPVSKFRFGAAAQTSEGESGTITQVVIDASTWAITHVAVRFGPFGGRFGTLYYAPFEQIAGATPDMVTLRISREALASFTAAPKGLTLSSSVKVDEGAKSLGHLVQLTFESASRALRHLVVERGLGSEWVISAQTIGRLDAKQITIAQGVAGAQKLSAYRPDSEIEQDIRDAIYDYARLRIDMGGINVHVIDGVVWLRGHVASELNRRLVADQIQGVDNITELHNDLIDDTELAASVSRALAADPRLREERIGVYPALGQVRLRGTVHTAEARTAAAEVARRVPAVGGVSNELHVDPTSTVLPVMAGVTGEEDAVPGGR
ncbi:MAG: BON domain-containing protein [Ktedonobacterales bacterium]